MLYWAFIFFVIAILSALLGFFVLAGVAMMFAKVLFIVFLVLFLISLLGGVMRRPR